MFKIKTRLVSAIIRFTWTARDSQRQLDQYPALANSIGIQKQDVR